MQRDINISYVGRPSQRLQLFTELKGKLDGASSDFLAGYKIKFPEGAITGYMTSKGKAYGTYTKSVEQNAIKLDFLSMIDFKKPTKNCSFGLNLTIGMM